MQFNQNSEIMMREEPLNGFAALSKRLRASGERVRVAVVCPDDPHTRYVIDRAESEGVAEFRQFGDAESPERAARNAVEAVRNRHADVLMKGKINTDVLLHAVLDKQCGLLRRNGILSHVTVADIPAYGKPLVFADAAVIPRPSLEQFDAITRYVTAVARLIGAATPKLALIHFTEKANEKFPHTLYYKELMQRAANGDYGSVCIGGPMDVKTALDSESGEIKGISSPVAGQADALVFPNIEAANTFYKTITLFANATTAGMLCGTTAPVVVSSRADSGESKYYSLVLACLMAKKEF